MTSIRFALFAGSAMVVAALAAPVQAAPKKQVAVAAAAPAPKGPPKLIVAISVDQFSADLFAQYRKYYTGGFARLLQGAVFPSGFQSHAATETCPGHSTILTGVHPSRNGIIANNWYDLTQKRAEKRVYCAEDEKDKDSTANAPVVSAVHLKVPTLGEWIKKEWPESRNVAVSAKDRAVMMMGGHKIDAGYWFTSQGFVSFNGVTLADPVMQANMKILALINKGAPPLPAPAWCGVRSRAIKAGEISVGTGRFAVDPQNFDFTPANQVKYSPRMDALTFDIAAGLAAEMKLGKGKGPDVLSVSLSATDYVGHAYGTEGMEMCIQQNELDQKLGAFFAKLDASGVDYAVVLTADHGGIDLPERLREQGMPEARRAEGDLYGEGLGKEIGAELGITKKLPPCTASPDSTTSIVCSDGLFGDYWISPELTPDMRAKVAAALVVKLKASPLVAEVFTRAQIMATPVPVGHPQEWTMLQRARASFDAERSGEVYSVLKRAVVPVTTPGPNATTVTTHGSPWDYDRRVPMLFWRKGVTGMEQPAPVETVDIAPTLAALIGLKVPEGAFDGRCLDMDGGRGDSCGK